MHEAQNYKTTLLGKPKGRSTFPGKGILLHMSEIRRKWSYLIGKQALEKQRLLISVQERRDVCLPSPALGDLDMLFHFSPAFQHPCILNHP